VTLADRLRATDARHAAPAACLPHRALRTLKLPAATIGDGAAALLPIARARTRAAAAGVRRVVAIATVAAAAPQPSGKLPQRPAHVSGVHAPHWCVVPLHT
jgi:hypothetical protein